MGTHFTCCTSTREPPPAAAERDRSPLQLGVKNAESACLKNRLADRLHAQSQATTRPRCIKAARSQLPTSHHCGVDFEDRQFSESGCLMAQGKGTVAIPGKRHRRRPKLGSMSREIVGIPTTLAHQALLDTSAASFTTCINQLETELVVVAAAAAPTHPPKVGGAKVGGADPPGWASPTKPTKHIISSTAHDFLKHFWSTLFDQTLSSYGQAPKAWAFST